MENIEKVIGRPVVSLETANKLGQVADLLVDPVSGQLTGLCVRRPDASFALASMLDVHGLGPDAMVVEHDQALVLAEASPLASQPRAKTNLVGVKVVTEHGQLLGHICNIFLCGDRRPTLIYEVRSSLLDSLLGRAFYFAASLGCAFSDDRTTLVVTGEPQHMYHSLDLAAERVLGNYDSRIYAAGVRIEVRTHAE